MSVRYAYLHFGSAFRYRDASANHAPYSAANHKPSDDVTYRENIYIAFRVYNTHDQLNIIYICIIFIVRNRLMYINDARKRIIATTFKTDLTEIISIF